MGTFRGDVVQGWLTLFFLMELVALTIACAWRSKGRP